VSASALYPLDVVKTRMQAGQKVRASLQRPQLAAMSIGHTVHTVLHCHHLASDVLFNTFSQRSSVTVCDCVTAIQKHDTSRVAHPLPYATSVLSSTFARHIVGRAVARQRTLSDSDHRLTPQQHAWHGRRRMINGVGRVACTHPWPRTLFALG
jgi:hypothetical protein